MCDTLTGLADILDFRYWRETPPMITVALKCLSMAFQNSVEVLDIVIINIVKVTVLTQLSIMTW